MENAPLVKVSMIKQHNNRERKKLEFLSSYFQSGGNSLLIFRLKNDNTKVPYTIRFSRTYDPDIHLLIIDNKYYLANNKYFFYFLRNVFENGGLGETKKYFVLFNAI